MNQEKVINNKKALIGSIISAVGGLILLVIRVAFGSEMEGIKNSKAMIIQVGPKTMSRPEYFEYASKMITGYTVGGIVLLILAAVLFLLYAKKKSN